VKTTRRLAHAFIARETTKKLQKQNALRSMYRQMCDTQEMQERMGKVFGSLVENKG
jgi:hypothetical protein